jgi:hypothetical protein
MRVKLERVFFKPFTIGAQEMLWERYMYREVEEIEPPDPSHSLKSFHYSFH